MARYQHLPIYRLTYECLARVMTVTGEFPREYKFTLGQKLKDEVIEMVVLIYRANSSADKRDSITALLERAEVVGLLVRLSHDLKLLSTKAYAAIVEMIQSIAKQAQGWKRSPSAGREEK